MMSSMPKHYIKIWETVLSIPTGKVASYSQVADLAGLPRRARLVSKALKSAPQEMQLPWHRVIRANGTIAFAIGSASQRTQIDRLQEEGVIVVKNRICMKQFQWQPDLAEMLWALKF